jgi:predicted N-acetyltransferase YhbS
MLPPAPLIDSRFLIRNAAPGEEEAVLQVALLALAMNTGWHDVTHEAREVIEAGVKRAFLSEKGPSSLVATHGHRIVAISILDDNPETENHLVSGPWVLSEYRNRGLGTALLWASLQQLADRGISSVFGRTRENSITAQFVYPKFGGVIDNISPTVENNSVVDR